MSKKFIPIEVPVGASPDQARAIARANDAISSRLNASTEGMNVPYESGGVTLDQNAQPQRSSGFVRGRTQKLDR